MHEAAGCLPKPCQPHFPCLTNESGTVLGTIHFGQNIFLIDDIPGGHQPMVALVTGPSACPKAAEPQNRVSCYVFGKLAGHPSLTVNFRR